jgi:hypothetical protein
LKPVPSTTLDQTRREFLAAAGALASVSLAAPDALAVEPGLGADSAAGVASIPPHTPLAVEGIHAYADRVSVAAGDTIRFHVSSSYPYELEVCRLGTHVDSPARDELLHSFGKSPAAVQPIQPGSYLLVEKPLAAAARLDAFTVEVWIRRWRTTGRQAIVSQFDQPLACGFGLFVNLDGSLSFYLGDGAAFVESNLHTTASHQLMMEVNPQGLQHFPDNTPSSVLANRWHHVIARFDGETKQIWVDGRQVGSWPGPGAVRPGPAALRIGAAARDGLTTDLLDADLAMPALYGKALMPAEIAERFATRALSRPGDQAILGCWPLNEERGERAADASTHGRHATIINNGTWMIGGPSFDADVARFGGYDPATDQGRGQRGNTAFWRVSLNADANVMECRKGDAPGTQVRTDRRGEMWHSHDGRRGGMSRECGFPAWRLFGLEYFSLVGVGAPGVGPYKVRNADHFLFRRPSDLGLRDGDNLGGNPGHPLPQPIGHEGDARVSTIARFLVEKPPAGGMQPTEDLAGITLLAEGFADARKIGFAWDYFQRPVPLAKNPPISVAAEMIYWDRPGGGRVFHAGSINAGMALARDPKWSGLLHNVLHHFGVERA